MAVENGSTEYTISTPFAYYSKEQSGEILASHLVMYEPAYEHSKYAYKIQQRITRLLMEIKERQGEMNDASAGEEVKAMHEEAKSIEENADGLAEAIGIGLMMSEKVDMSEFVELWSDMVTAPSERQIVLIDGHIPLNNVTLKRMNPNDVLGAAVRWAAFFGMPSWMQNSASAGRSV